MAVKDFYTQPDVAPQLGSDHAGNVRSVVNGIVTAMNTLLAKLDADAGITDTDYAATIGTLDTLGGR